jgi:hypothetical protein
MAADLSGEDRVKVRELVCSNEETPAETVVSAGVTLSSLPAVPCPAGVAASGVPPDGCVVLYCYLQAFRIICCCRYR